MTKELVITALKDAIRHSSSTEGCILHSDYAEENTMPKFAISSWFIEIFIYFFGIVF